MAVPGTKPTDGPTRFRGKSSVDWTDVTDVAYEGPRPDLPVTRLVWTGEGYSRQRLTTQARRWWETVSAMPHCKLWSDGDWLFALETALIADTFYRDGDMGSARELRARSKTLGTTVDARRDLRIRYVPVQADDDAAPEHASTNPDNGTVTSISSRRRRLSTDAT